MLPFRFLFSLALLSLVAAPVYATTLAEAAVRDTLTGGTFTPICIDGGFGETEADAMCDQDNNYGWARFEDRLSVGSGLLTPGEWTDVRIVIDLEGASYANVVPEPTTALLLGLGLGLGGLALRRRL